jgi:hypothetical protein
MSPKLHFISRIVIAAAAGVAAGSLPPLWGIWLPLGIVFNISLGIFFLLFWIWPFPWEEVMLLGLLEDARRKVLPHDRGLRISADDCTAARCVLAGAQWGRCIRLQHMMEQTRKKGERLNDAVFRSGAPYCVSLIVALIVAGPISSNAPAAAAGPWQVVQVLLGVLSIASWLAMTYVEASNQRSLNFELIAPTLGTTE